MAGHAAPFSKDRRDILRRAGTPPGVQTPQNELEIFLSLCVGRVFYRRETRMLYFVDSPALSVSEIIHQTFKGLGQQARIEQRFMDEHGVLRAAMVIRLSEAQRAAVMAALTLSVLNIIQSGMAA